MRIWQRRRTKASEERRPASKASRSSSLKVRTNIGSLMPHKITLNYRLVWICTSNAWVLVEVVMDPLTSAGRKGALVSGEGAKIPAACVPAGGDRFRRHRDIHYTTTVIDIKVSTLDTDGGLSVAEISTLEKGGPVRHLHHEQEEWFYVVEGEYVIEVGEERYELGGGD